MDITFIPSPNDSPRGGRDINWIFLHYTSDSGGAVDFFQKKNTASAHYVVLADGKVVQMVEHDRAAWHIGNFKLNQQSIGIEVVNWGELTPRADGQYQTWAGYIIPFDQTVPYEGRRWERYSPAAVESAVLLVQRLSQELNIPLDYPFDTDEYPYFMDYHESIPLDLFQKRRGVAGHCHVKKGKADPGPHWLELVPAIRP